MPLELRNPSSVNHRSIFIRSDGLDCVLDSIPFLDETTRDVSNKNELDMLNGDLGSKWV